MWAISVYLTVYKALLECVKEYHSGNLIDRITSSNLIDSIHDIESYFGIDNTSTLNVQIIIIHLGFKYLFQD